MFNIDVYIRQVLNRSVKSDETLGSFDEKAYLVAKQKMVIRHLLIAPNRIYYLIDANNVVIMGIAHVKRSPEVVTSMIKRFLEHYER